MLTNVHDKTDTLETFQPVTVGIHVQEMKGFRKELILSILSPHPFEDEQVEEEKTKTKSVKRSGEKESKSDKKRKV